MDRWHRKINTLLHCAIISWSPLKKIQRAFIVWWHTTHTIITAIVCVCVRFFSCSCPIDVETATDFSYTETNSEANTAWKGRQQNRTKTHSKRIKLAFVFCRNQATDVLLLLFYQRRLSFGRIILSPLYSQIEWKRILSLSMTRGIFPTSNNSSLNCLFFVQRFFFHFGVLFFMHI